MTLYRHAAPLEMTVAVSHSHVISTAAKRSGEISLLYAAWLWCIPRLPACRYVAALGSLTSRTEGPLRHCVALFAPLGSVSLDSQSSTDSLRIQFPCHLKGDASTPFRMTGPAGRRRSVCRLTVSMSDCLSLPCHFDRSAKETVKKYRHFFTVSLFHQRISFILPLRFPYRRKGRRWRRCGRRLPVSGG